MSASSQQLLQDDKAHENKGPAILATCSSLTAVATLFVAARLYVRVSILSRVGLDDWLIVISLTKDLSMVLDGWVFNGSVRVRRYPLRTVHSHSVAVGLFGEGDLLEPLGAGKLCHRSRYKAISAAVDLYLALYPALVLYRLRINRRKKIALSIALGLGSVAGAVAIYKSTRLPALASPDFTYDSAGITVWTSIEGNAIIIAACIPTLQPLLDRLLKRRIFGSTDNYQKQADYQGHVTPRVELATIGSRSRTNPKTKGKMGISDTTIGRDSEEEILNSEEPQRHSEDEEVGGRGERQSVAGQNGGILRTQRTTVTYEDSPLSSAGKLVKEREINDS
ncbi:integral membrane [Pyrenophora seminiperda CCB06]|uniref:Integral membrane n=1 Tax=Pyrenophora seminiperda CCB06 TaxID=1302712 RepID=A0A3M7MDA8_9PLEO|nr:integral membrane [Pyrenophora seminiperda CCB06]